MKDRWSFNYGDSRIIILSKGRVESYENSTGKHFITADDRFYIMIITGRIRKNLTDNIIKSLLMGKSTQVTFAPFSRLALVLKDEVFKEVLRRIDGLTD